MQSQVPPKPAKVWQLRLIKAEVVPVLRSAPSYPARLFSTSITSTAPPESDAEGGLEPADSDVSDETGVEREAAAAAEEVALHGYSNYFTPDIRERFMRGSGGDVVTCDRRLAITAKWRADNGVDSILTRPQPHFKAVKQHYGHGVLCYTKTGYPVYIDKNQELYRGLPKLLAAGLTEKEVLDHLIFIQEYLWQKVDPRPVEGGKLLYLADLQGMRIMDLGSHVSRFIIKMTGTIQNNYCERLYRAYVVNAPKFFTLVWKLIEPTLSEDTRRRIKVLSTKEEAFKALREELYEEDIPAEYGGPNATPLYESKYERELSAYVESLGQ